jgi:SAM-dependent methyltransferase
VTAPVGTELLDDPAADPGAVRRSLRHITRANWWFGGVASLGWALGRVTRGVAPGSELRLLDLGTGAGDLPLAARRWGARRGIRIVPTGLELSRVAASLARGAGVPTFVADAIAPPVRSGCVDIVLVSQLAHHLSPDGVVSLFEAANRVTRGAVIVLDLRRARFAGIAFRAGATLLRFDRVTRHDGLVSIRRGYTAPELRALARRAGVPATVSRRPGYRLVAVWGTAGATTSGGPA